MTLADFIPLVLKCSVVALVFALGLRAKPHDLVGVFGHPMQFVRSLVAMNVVMVAFAVIVVLVFPLPTPIRIALIALALSPVPPILPGKQIKVSSPPRSSPLYSFH
jgi:bile acid:Na+ symporter, BASS family